MKDDLKFPLPPLPLMESTSETKPTPAPAMVSLIAVWIALLTLIGSIALPLLPGSRHPRAELEHLQPYSLADRFLPVPIYGSVIGLFLGIVVIWQMRKEPRPLPEAMVNQRLQAWVAIALALLAAAVIYLHVALRGPGGARMKLKVNGDEREVVEGTTIRALVEQFQMVPEKVAIELNRRLVRAEKYDTPLANGDEVEIVTFVGGG